MTLSVEKNSRFNVNTSQAESGDRMEIEFANGTTVEVLWQDRHNGRNRFRADLSTAPPELRELVDHIKQFFRRLLSDRREVQDGDIHATLVVDSGFAAFVQFSLYCENVDFRPWRPLSRVVDVRPVA